MVSSINQFVRRIMVNKNPLEDGSHDAVPPLRLQSDFCSMAETLRAQFEKHVRSAMDVEDGLTAFTYAVGLNHYQFLTASAERIFSRDALETLMSELRVWAKDALGASYLSTPQARVYINGCGRDVAPDRTPARWRWMLSLSRNGHSRIGRLKVFTRAIPADIDDEAMTLDRVFDLQLKFNQLLVHEATAAYGIEPARGSMNPLEEAVFLDGYLW